jgi:superfamily II DNA or RNA helicase
MADHYRSTAGTFRLFESAESPMWRPPQLGALGELLGHWSLPNRPPALISIPTGSGKSAIATAAPYLVSPLRVLVVVPSKDVRRQLTSEFETERVLHKIGARSDSRLPRVREVTGLVESWKDLEAADVVVGIPASISPSHYTSQPPPKDLFDLVIVDEAHHAPAPTWRAILEHFGDARALLLTATPTRRDGQRVPGEIVYHYPLRQALDEMIYKPVEPLILDLGPDPSRGESDVAIVQQTVTLAASAEHSESAVLIRVGSIERAREVADLYKGHGLHTEVLSSRVSQSAREKIVDDLRSGRLKAVAVVDMLGEGFDLPRIRIAAYHDKHKSMNATVQLIGRLARVDSQFPQASIIVSARDQDVFPQLRGLVRSLWEEDADWAVVLPGLIDDEVAEALADREFATHFSDVPPELSLEALRPLVRAIIYEVEAGTWEPSFVDGNVVAEFAQGQVLHGKSVFYSGVTPTSSTLIVVTASRNHPKWMIDTGLDSSEFELHLFSWHPAADVGQSHVLVVNSSNLAVARKVIEILDPAGACRLADPRAVQDAFDSIDRSSVSNVGVRNTYAGGRGTASYRMFAGSGVDRGLRAADTANSALGHAMAQVAEDGSSFNIGIATGKAKYWESRYVRIRDYENRIADFVSRLRFPPSTGPGRLLPTLARGERFDSFPDSIVVAIELNARLRGQDWRIGDHTLDVIDFLRDETTAVSRDRLDLVALLPGQETEPLWKGWHDTSGKVHDSAEGVEVRRGYGSPRPLSELLTDHPLTTYFGDGSAVFGGTFYPRPGLVTELPDIRTSPFDWSPYDITVETEGAKRSGGKPSVHAALQQWLLARPRLLRHRWVFFNDGKGELADYVVVEVDPGPTVHVSFWHAKASAAATPSVRVKDMQVVVTQAFKSRRWATDATLWRTIRRRYKNEEAPALKLIDGRPRLFEALCGMVDDHPRYSLDRFPPTVTCEIGIAQPGLSYSQLQADLERDEVPLASHQVRELLTVCNDAVLGIGMLRLLVTE